MAVHKRVWRSLAVGVAVLAAAVLLVERGRSRPPAPAPGAQAAEAEGPYGTLVIRDAILVDGTGAPAQGPVDIVIRKNVIEAILPVGNPLAITKRAARPTGDRVIEAKGMYVMPGIIDMHTHMNPGVPADYIYKLWLGSGVTTVRVFNVGNDTPAQMVAEKRRIVANPRTIEPRIYTYPFWKEYGKPEPRLWNAAGAKQLVQEWKAEGVDGVKMIGKPGLYPDVLRAICEEARKLGMGVAVHIGQDGVYPMNAVEVARAGVTSIEHHYGYAEAAFSDKTIQNLPPDYNYSNEPARFLYTGKVWLETDVHKLHAVVIPELLAIAKKTGFTMDPTFVVYEGNRDVERVQHLPWHPFFTLPSVWKGWTPNPALHASFYYHWTSNDEAVWARMFRRWMDFVNDYKNQGGQVSVGSDPGFIYNLWGFGTIREMEMLERAGFNPLETIHSATAVGAHALGNDRLGVIRPGYLADLLILRTNPLDDLKALYPTGIDVVSREGKVSHVNGIEYTVRDGVVFDTQALLGDVKELVRRAKAAGAAR